VGKNRALLVFRNSLEAVQISAFIREIANNHSVIVDRKHSGVCSFGKSDSSVLRAPKNKSVGWMMPAIFNFVDMREEADDIPSLIDPSRTCAWDC
jgi:hypothetical protein